VKLQILKGKEAIGQQPPKSKDLWEDTGSITTARQVKGRILGLSRWGSI
jgi:hypothetical protein